MAPEDPRGRREDRADFEGEGQHVHHRHDRHSDQGRADRERRRRPAHSGTASMVLPASRVMISGRVEPGRNAIGPVTPG